jgi:hypothetical protein
MDKKGNGIAVYSRKYLARRGRTEVIGNKNKNGIAVPAFLLYGLEEGAVGMVYIGNTVLGGTLARYAEFFDKVFGDNIWRMRRHV